ncbi:hypothetical protein QJS10_CPA01g00247 [Acorus calamus]|uniref:Helicase ATP-binding domain-containing protein n=1 Tax=Acorus calamus TaxID=4465 RepID=A0AAV9FFT3_ACOCL|nr:hypothetical protein QJS10_CPA01g00247 [Acorus calamus]
MAPPTQKSPNPNRNVYQIGGVPVEFPYKPYGSRLAFMGKVISTLDRTHRQGHWHALLESPTGTGKSLSLLCSTLAWQRHYLSRMPPQPDPRIDHDPLINGGGFLVEPEPPSRTVPGKVGQSQTASNETYVSRWVLNFIFDNGSRRTHSQISQVLHEYRKTSYRAPMEILASRKHYCTNKSICGKDSVDEECYIIDPIVLRAMQVNIRGAIVILDEAHNMEDMARDAGSLDVEEEALHVCPCQALQAELGQFCIAGNDALMCQPLYDMIQGIITWMGHKRDKLERREFEHYCSSWTGDKALRELQEAGISLQCFPVLQSCASKAIKAASEADPEVVHLSGMSSITLECLFSSFCYFFSENGIHAVDYNLTLRTLFPMSSFTSELGIQFDACMEAPHVIDVESQLWASVISTGPGNCQLNASYKTADGYAFQDELGASLEEICKIVPGGALVFFPSYKLLEKLRACWCKTEPRGTMEDLEPVLKGYYDSIRKKNGCVSWKYKRGQKRNFNQLDTRGTSESSPQGGAASLAVCRGKVAMKKKYNDMYRTSKNLLSGSDWYCHQAFRALNQAAGRCIRHRFDYGAIIFMDERFKEERSLRYVSKWLGKSIKQYDNFDASLEGLRTFFGGVKERIAQNKMDICLDGSPVPDIRKENFSPSEQYMLNGKSFQKTSSKVDGCSGKKSYDRNKATAKSLQSTKKVSMPKILSKVLISKQKSQANVSNGESVDVSNKVFSSYREYINLECPSQKSTCRSFIASSDNSSEQCEIANSPSKEEDVVILGVTTKNADSHSTLLQVQQQDQLSNQRSFGSASTTNSNENTLEGAYAYAVTPERKVDVGSRSLDDESLLNMSVNSHSQMKRVPVDLQLGRHNLMESLSSPKAESSCSTSLVQQGLIMDKRLYICCRACKNPLGLPENHFLVPCSLTSSSKAYLASLLKNGPGSDCSRKVEVVISDISSVDERLFGVVAHGDGSQSSFWCEEDGCVYKMVFCPFCSVSLACLGLQILATDALNINLINKVMFYADRLELEHQEASPKELRLPRRDNVPGCGDCSGS